MTTYIKDFIYQLEDQWNEVDVLLDAAKINESNIELFNAICRSTSVLIISHMEGFLKDLIKNIVNDLNNESEFKDIPKAFQRTCCEGYLDLSQNTKSSKHEDSIRDMISHLSNCTGYKIPHDFFLFDKNRNPKPDSIQSLFKKMGHKDIFQSLHNSIFDSAFISNKSSDRLLKISKHYLPRSVDSLPYNTSLSNFNLNKEKYSGKTLWQEFLDEANKSRHAIAHGNTFSNDEDLNALIAKRNKTKLLQMILIYIACSLTN